MVAQRDIGQQWTVEQYLEMEAWSNPRHEFVDGRVYAMAGGDQNHSRISINVTALLADHLFDWPGNPCGVFNTDMMVRLANERDHVYPDAVLIRYPRLVVEVLSDSTERYDRGAKFELYRERGALYEYVLVEAHEVGVEVCSRTADDSWTTVTYDPGNDVVSHSVDLVVPIAALYRGIAFSYRP